MEDDMLLVSKEDHIATIVLNRPAAHNSLHPQLVAQLPGVFADLAADGQTRCAIIRGAGDRAFSAGYDISSIPENDARSPQDLLRRAMSAITEFPFPVIAMIKGYCMGAGFELAATCDFRIAAEDARFKMPPAKLGVLYHPTGVLRFMNLVGVGWTKYLFCTGRQFTAQRLREIGLVEEVVATEELEAFTLSIAREICENAPLSVSGAKQTVNILQSYQQVTMGDMDQLLALVDRCFVSEDVKEGKRSFAEKRKPVFQGR